MDLITDLPKSQEFDSVLTIVDQGCSKAAKFIPCNKTIDGPGLPMNICGTSSLGSDSPNELSQTETCDSPQHSQRKCARPLGSNRISPQPSTLGPMAKLRG